MPRAPRKTIVVAGAAGLVGRALPAALGDDYDLIGLTRHPVIPATTPSTQHDYTWRVADLFSRRQTLEALQGADAAIYLVHSMHPSAALTQGRVRDMDLLCADNFARAASHHGIKKVICISSLSASNEIETTLAARGASVCVLRASIILGPGGDRTEMLVRLVKKLPVMVLPAWTRTPVRPIAREDIVQVIRFVLEDEACAERTWDVAGPDVTTFAEMLQLTAEFLYLKRTFYYVGFNAPRTSTRWIAAITGLPREMIRPTITSLHNKKLSGDFSLQARAGLQPMPLRDALQQSILADKPPTRRLLNTSARQHDAHPIQQVRSVQRMSLPPGHGAEWVARTYGRWLSRFLWPFVHVKVRQPADYLFLIRGLPWPLLILELDQKVSQPDRQLFWIRGGLLAGKQSQGRLEFREVLNKKYVLAAIHDFRPRLPWPTYLMTQARIHLLVMYAFGQYLKKVSRSLRLQNDKTRHLPDSET